MDRHENDKVAFRNFANAPRNERDRTRFFTEYFGFQVSVLFASVPFTRVCCLADGQWPVSGRC